MLRHLLGALAALVLTVSLVPDDAFARGGGRGGGGMRGSGFHGGGGMHAGGIGGGGRGNFAGRPHPSHPIAGRPGRPGHPIAGRPGYGGGYRPGWGYGAAAVGAAAVAGAYYGGYGNYGYNPYYDYNDGGSYVEPESDPLAECARRFKTYDPVSQTYIKRKGVRASCP